MLGNQRESELVGCKAQSKGFGTELLTIPLGINGISELREWVILSTCMPHGIVLCFIVLLEIEGKVFHQQKD